MHVLYIPYRSRVRKDICRIGAGVNKHFCCVAFHGRCTFLIKGDRLSTRMRLTVAVGFGAKWPLTETQLLRRLLRPRIVVTNRFVQLSGISEHTVFKTIPIQIAIFYCDVFNWFRCEMFVLFTAAWRQDSATDRVKKKEREKSMSFLLMALVVSSLGGWNLNLPQST